MLAETDRTLIIAIPLLVITVAVGRPSVAGVWIVIGALCLAFTLTMAMLGRAGRAPWRGVGYAIVTLIPALGTLWTIGPVTGSGAMIGLAVLFAGAFLPRAYLVVVVVAVIAAVIARAWAGEPWRPIPTSRIRPPVTSPTTSRRSGRTSSVPRQVACT